MRTRLASPLSLIVAAVLGGLVSQAVSRWMPEARAQDEKVPKEIRARRIVVVDETGNERIILNTKKNKDSLDGAWISVIGAGGTEALPKDSREAVLSCDQNGPRLILLVAEHSQAMLEVSPKGSSLLHLKGKANPDTEVTMGVGDDSMGRVTISDGVRIRAVMGVTPLETGEKARPSHSTLLLSDKDGKQVWMESSAGR